MMEQALLLLLNKLEEIGRDHQELYDTDVKEQTAERFIQVFFIGEAEFSGSAEYGMFSEKGNEAIHDAFAALAERLVRSKEFAAAEDEEKWQIFNAAITAGGQLAENFFGALTPDNVHPATAPKRSSHWLQASPVYVLFIAVPGISAFLVAVLAFPDLINGPLRLLAFVVLAGFGSLCVGDYSYQFVANRTYRKPRDRGV